MASTRTRQPARPAFDPPRTPPPGNGSRGGGNGRGPGKPRKKPRPAWLRRTILFFQFITTLILLTVLVGLGGIYYMYRTLPSAWDMLKSYQPEGRTEIYSSDGVELANLFQENRQHVNIDNIPLIMQQSTVAIEDRRFYTNVGVDFRGIGRALVRDVKGGRSKEGASTITQQLVRNIGIGGVGREKTISRKIKEALYAIQIERNFSKQQILELYLNQVYYGSGAYGVQTAAQTYFAKNVDELDLAQCAMLAGLPKGPSQYSPYVNYDAATKRRNLVLHSMLEVNYITPIQYTDAINEPIKLAYSKSPQGKSHIMHAAYFVDYVVKQMNANFGADYVQRGGIKVYTTLDWGMQQAAEQAVDDTISDGDLGASQAALIALDPHTGFIRAMVGGVDFNKSQFNIAAEGRRQPGSSFKPIIYTAAIDSGLITEDTPILDAPVSFPGGNGMWSPQDDDHRTRGFVTAKEAMAQSINIPAVKVLHLVGIDTAIRYARMMGVTSPLAPYLTLALGASGCTPLEMACAYATIDNLGERPSPLCVKTITSEKGDILYTANTTLETTPISKDAFSQVKDMMHAVTTEGTARGTFADGSFPDACGKTGTTQNHKDVWFNGFTTDMVCTVWAGHPTVDDKGHYHYGDAMNGYAFGSTICAPIWKQFMLAAKPMIARDKIAAAKNAPPPQPVAAPDDTADTGDTGDTAGNDDSTDNTPQPRHRRHNSDAPSGHVTVWIDGQGNRVAPGTSGAHTEQFTRGTEPSMGDSGDNSTDNGNGNDNGDTGGGNGDTGGGTDNGGHTDTTPATGSTNGGSVQPDSDTGGGAQPDNPDDSTPKPPAHHHAAPPP